MRTRVIWAVSLIVLLTAGAVFAVWVTNGNPVCTATGAQDYIAMTADGLGGAAMVWQDNRGASLDIYAQEIDGFGVNQWGTPNGVALCTATGGQLYPRVIHNGFGYLHFAWQDYRSGNADVYIASTDRLGNIFTPANGLGLCTAVGDQSSPSMSLYAPTGQIFAAWGDTRNGNGDIYFGSFSQYSGITTPANGSPVCTLPSAQEFPAVATRMLGHGVVAWSDFRNGNYDIYAQSMGFTGAQQWAANGVPVCTATGAQLDVMIVEDPNYGVIVAWRDFRNGTFTQAIYAQRLDSAGVPQWAANGVLVAQSSDLIVLPKMIPDGAGGAIIAWEDDRNIATTGPDIYAQRINSSGSVLWAANGALVCSANFAQYGTEMVSDGANGAVITWFDYRSLGPVDVYAQRMNSAGSATWLANGVPVSVATGNQSNPKIAQVDAGGAIVGWEDRRTFGTTDTDVYAQRIDIATGAFGYPEPYITSIVDVPSDQGGFVRLTFRQGDGQQAGEEFEIYDVEYHGGDVVHVGTFNGSATYTVDVLNTGVGIPNTYYVWAGYQSNSVAGTSIDNLAPPAPTLSGQRVGNNVELSWNATAPDIDHYSLQRADLGVIVVTGTSYVDTNVPLTTIYYRINATDIHQNSGPNSNQVTIDPATPIGDTPVLPKVLALRPNSPNPFSASTALHVGLPREADVQLEVYDVAGRRVFAREVGRMAAGWRDIAFDGRGNDGQPLASGVYFYRITAAGETTTRKMVIGR